MPPRRSWILVWLLLTGFTGAVRFAWGSVAEFALHAAQAAVACRHLRRQRSRCAILAASLRLAGNHRILTLRDDEPGAERVASESLLLEASRIKASHSLSVADAWIAAAALIGRATLVHKDSEFEAIMQLDQVWLA